ncbi:peroxidase 41 [Eucalyptus grandis]|uniref:peroxidase 41 n=1 Tax=Eucalyptus grandis TaxID=71139 RepID=UPI00192EC329|nr:peroxidase 41 [Eucalyptus grandis]
MDFHHLILLLLFVSISVSEAKLSPNYYQKSCPDFERIVRETITDKQMSTPTTAAGTLRLFVHDCLVEGCDASVLVSSNSFNQAERDHDINLSLPGDAFEVVTRAKTALELSCPKTVSCADILAQATRDLISMVGGPFYTVKLGRKDGLVSKASRVEGNLPRISMSFDENIKIFESRGFTVQEFAALLGGHTIGFSHCKEFSDRIFNYGKTSGYDPALNPKFVAGLRQLCANSTRGGSMAAFNDVMTPGKFDNMYYQNLPRGLGLLAIDHALYASPRTRPFVEMFAKDQAAFFQAFSRAMEKFSVLGAKTGRNGEIRSRCDAFNSLRT